MCESRARYMREYRQRKREEKLLAGEIKPKKVAQFFDHISRYLTHNKDQVNFIFVLRIESFGVYLPRGACNLGSVAAGISFRTSSPENLETAVDIHPGTYPISSVLESSSRNSSSADESDFSEVVTSPLEKPGTCINAADESKKATSSDPDDAPPCKVPRLAEADETSGNVESTNRQRRGPSAVQYKESESEESVDCPGVEQTDYPLPAQVKAEPEYVAVAGQFEVVNLPSAGQLADEEPLNNSVDAISTPQNQLCRLCVKNEGLVPLFQRSGAPRVLAIQAMTVTRVKVSSKDGLPARICRRCEDLLQQSFHFKLQCEVADVTLRSKVAARAVAPEALSTAFSLLTDQLDKTLRKLNCIVSSLKYLESNSRDRAHVPGGDTAPFESVNVKIEPPSSPSGSSIEIKTEIDYEEDLSEFEGDRQQLEPCVDSTSGSEEQTDGLLSSEELPPEKTEVPGTQPEMPVMQTSQEESGSSRLRERLQPSEPPSSAQLPGEHGTVRLGLQVKDFGSLRSLSTGNPPNLSAEVGGRVIPQLVKLADGSMRLCHVYVPDPCPLLAPADGLPLESQKSVPAELSCVQTPQAVQATAQVTTQLATKAAQAQRERGKNSLQTSKQIGAPEKNPQRVQTELISVLLKTQTEMQIREPFKKQILAQESDPSRTQAIAQASDPSRTQAIDHRHKHKNTCK
ncbi:uncharacterized protein LOC134535401 [Bacillus rossius redtenbacheri]|uniref:uncharacterized protein LOC134535401 n=1 Tax=Bacillus rossius redtenbacheri TaxID=93214 RepID=UPI002FDE4979